MNGDKRGFKQPGVIQYTETARLSWSIKNCLDLEHRGISCGTLGLTFKRSCWNEYCDEDGFMNEEGVCSFVKKSMRQILF